MDEDETEELKEALQSLENDWEKIGEGITNLGEEIYYDNCLGEKVKKFIEDVELWVKEIQNTIDDLDEARIIFQRKEMINSLST